MLEFFRGKRGGLVSIFLVAILVPLMAFGTSLTELSRMHSATQIFNEAADVAAYSMLSEYDKQLLKRFGILAMVVSEKEEEANQEEFNSYLKQNLGGSENQFINTILSFDDADIEMLYSLNEEDILKKQIDEIVKVRTPANMALDGLDLLDLTGILNKQLEKTTSCLEAVSDGLESCGNFCDLLSNIRKTEKVRKKLKKEVKEADKLVKEIKQLKEKLIDECENYMGYKKKLDKKFQFEAPSCKDASVTDADTRTVIEVLTGMPDFSILEAYLREQNGIIPGDGVQSSQNSAISTQWGTDAARSWDNFLNKLKEKNIDWQSYYSSHAGDWQKYWGYYAQEYQKELNEYSSLPKKMEKSLEKINELKKKIETKIDEYVDHIEKNRAGDDGKGIEILISDYKTYFNKVKTSLNNLSSSMTDFGTGKVTKSMTDGMDDEEKKVVKKVVKAEADSLKTEIADFNEAIGTDAAEKFDKAKEEAKAAKKSANELGTWLESTIGEVSSTKVEELHDNLPKYFKENELNLNKGCLKEILSIGFSFWRLWKALKEKVKNSFGEIVETYENLLKVAYYLMNDRVIYDMRYQVQLKGEFTEWADGQSSSANEAEDKTKVHDFMYSKAGNKAAAELGYNRDSMDPLNTDNEMSWLQLILRQIKTDFSSLCDAVGELGQGIWETIEALGKVAFCAVKLFVDVKLLIIEVNICIANVIVNSAKLASYGVDMFSNRTTAMDSSATTLLGERMNDTTTYLHKSDEEKEKMKKVGDETGRGVVAHGQETELSKNVFTAFIETNVAIVKAAKILKEMLDVICGNEEKEDTCFAMAEAEYILFGQNSEVVNQALAFLVIAVERIPLNIPAALTSEVSESFSVFFGVGYWVGVVLVLLLETIIDMYLLVKGVSIPLIKTSSNIFVSAKGLKNLITCLEEAAKNVASSFDVKNEVTEILGIGELVALDSGDDDKKKDADNEGKKDSEESNTTEKDAGATVKKYLTDKLKLDYGNHLWFALLFVPDDWKLKRIYNLMEMEMRKKTNDDTFSLANAYTYMRIEANATWNTLLPMPKSVFGADITMAQKKVVSYRGY